MNQFEFECEFDGALQALSGIAESLHAAGADACVHALDDGGISEDRDARGRGWVRRSRD